MTPTIGRIVLYTLTEKDAEQIQRRRTTSASIRERMEMRAWPEGAQAHMGNDVQVGVTVPAIIVAVWPTTVSLRCFLDGTDEFWATSRPLYTPDTPEMPSKPPAGSWAWPVISK